MSDWNPSGTTPQEVGVYETEADDCPTFQHWNGKWWGRCAYTPAEALKKATCKSYFQDSQWRGIASDPSQSKEGK